MHSTPWTHYVLIATLHDTKLFMSPNSITDSANQCDKGVFRGFMSSNPKYIHVYLLL